MQKRRRLRCIAKLPVGLTLSLGRVGDVSYQGTPRPSMDPGLNAVVVLGVAEQEFKHFKAGGRSPE